MAIQIHLMLFFISGRQRKYITSKNIQIHLMLFFIFPACNMVDPICDSNTSHVILYRKRKLVDPLQFENSNTSHVILYLPGHCLLLLGQPFKYISCYSLSASAIRFARAAETFKYISCYSLSNTGSFKGADQSVFKYISCYSLSTSSKLISCPRLNSNTSHVILYPVLHKFLHLLVLDSNDISCYSLSVFRS